MFRSEHGLHETAMEAAMEAALKQHRSGPSAFDTTMAAYKGEADGARTKRLKKGTRR